MRQKLEQLKNEFARGEAQISLLDRRRQELRDTLLRISGAIQVLEELLEEENARGNEPSHSENGSAPIAAA